MINKVKSNIIDSSLAAVIIFYGALVFCLPVPHSYEVVSLYPWWSKKIGFGNIQLQELLFIVWFFLVGFKFEYRTLLKGGIPTRQAGVWLISLALWCGLISLTAPLPWIDTGRTFRLLLNVALMFAVVRWTKKSGNMPLTMLVLGFFTGTIINLIISFRFPLIVNETMRLSGQSTPGVAMGIAIHLSAWLFFTSKQTSIKIFSFCSALVFSMACSISYSRVGWFAGGLGLIAWGYVLLIAKPKDRTQKKYLKILRILLVPAFFASLAIAQKSQLIQESLHWVTSLIEQKVSGPGESDSIRWAYVEGTMEIILRSPQGVGYSGFYDAMIETDIYSSGKAAEEESANSANPHATILWYITAGGIPGGIISIMVFLLLLNSLRIGLRISLGSPGRVLFFLILFPFIVISLTVPYLFNSTILIVPTAIAAGWGWRNKISYNNQTA
ncbi:MAG: hypothetical protein D6B28_04085 [Gammaproteobacteria bacterium]|nr:MAG: hypothetical protein D6B28_04085 [Gammaproteobacteria bacterium]